ncbi:hypothetical protein UNDYM_4044 [Undibacterium sp. YM2]|uniref:class I SAM-dependent methyltransferase n=1 Tax=Undibacterium sp. YM2 TaxID=2058625 RepID=UPI001331CADC|nr:class I SAM-dependent methyltransferase [Undibacterium sp. YM2]BBB68297.1 hypothetical protein UNDYM_4044 [Undibacterium sp. YM2]
MNKTILIFPAGMPQAVAFMQSRKNDTDRLIGASSLALDPARQAYGDSDWLHLPFVNHADFDQALSSAIQEQGITSIYTPHAVVWDYLNRLLPTLAPAVSLLNTTPANTELDAFRVATQWARAVLEQPIAVAAQTSIKPDLPLLSMAALYRHVQDIPGMCDHEKLRALYEIARSCPAGDVVEIGSWWGKSAFILGHLAQSFGLGNVLCIDPWSETGIVSEGADSLVEAAFTHFSAEEAFGVFLVNLLPYSQGRLNYLRMPSLDGASYYASHDSVNNTMFGNTSYSGQIALLHIDGNHSEDSARADVAAWCPLVAPGGWIVIDDYSWPFGDGPRRAADAYLANYQAEIATAFFMGGALFIQKKVQHP